MLFLQLSEGVRNDRVVSLPPRLGLPVTSTGRNDRVGRRPDRRRTDEGRENHCGIGNRTDLVREKVDTRQR